MQAHPGANPAFGSRVRLFARTALCGVLSGIGALSGTVAVALPVGGFAEVNTGGGNPVVTETVGRTDITLNASRTGTTHSSSVSPIRRCSAARWTSSPTISRTSTPTASR